MRKLIDIAIRDSAWCLYGLADDGTLWKLDLTTEQWKQLPSLPPVGTTNHTATNELHPLLLWAVSPTQHTADRVHTASSANRYAEAGYLLVDAETEAAAREMPSRQHHVAERVFEGDTVRFSYLAPG